MFSFISFIQKLAEEVRTAEVPVTRDHSYICSAAPRTRKMANQFDENWQTARSTLKERNKFMYNNILLSDVSFVLTNSESAAARAKVTVPAHKYVLAISSPVFFAMFYGDLAETKDSIEISDCDSESFLELMRHIYCDEEKLTGNCVMEVLYLAKKYMIPSLVQKCSRYLEENLCGGNVFMILPYAQKFEEEYLIRRCWEVIDLETEEAIKSDPFCTIEKPLLREVLARESLDVKEVELFDAANQWATMDCRRKGITASGGAKRESLGEDTVFLLRFPIMTQKEFASQVVDKGILLMPEIVGMMKYFNGLEVPGLKFLQVARRGTKDQMKWCKRFGNVCDTGMNQYWPYGCGKADCIKFSVNQDILLLGFQLFGTDTGHYSLMWEVQENQLPQYQPVVIKQGIHTHKAGTVIKLSDGYPAFDLMFDEPILLKANRVCHLKAIISGPSSCYGQGGTIEQHIGKVKFIFSNCFESDNGTSVTRGQFPKIYFKIP